MIGINRGALRKADPNLKLELKFNQNVYTDLAGTIPAGVNDYVRAWKSSVGGHLLTQSTDAARPQRISDGLFFDGGDTLGMAIADGAWFVGDFTIEYWLQRTGTGGAFSMTLFAAPASIPVGINGINPSTNEVIYASTSSGTWNVVNQNMGAKSSSWTHYAIVRSNVLSIAFQNGVIISTAACQGAIYWPAGMGLFLMRHDQFNAGKMTDFRIWNTAKYSATFTPPTRST
jgi:hypothetical protein